MHLCVFRRVSFISLLETFGETLWLLYVLCEKKNVLCLIYSL